MDKIKILEKAREYNACDEAIEWLEELSSTELPWEICKRGDWMLWFAAKAGVDIKILIKAACKCARLSLVYIPDGEERPRKAIETAEAWIRGEATLNDVKKAADAAGCYSSSASYSAYTYKVAYGSAVSYYSSYSAYYSSVYSAAYAADAAAYAADAAAHAEDADVYALIASDVPIYAAAASIAKRASISERCAIIVRDIISSKELEKCLNK